MTRFSQDDIPSPCVAICTLDAARQLCIGCWRTVEEITAWPRLDSAARRAVLAQCEKRQAEQVNSVD